MDVFLMVCVMLLVSVSSAHAGYRSTLKKWTRTAQRFNTNTMQAKVIWKTTYFSPDFRKAFIQQHIKKKYLDPIEAAQFTAQQENRAAQSEEFFISLYSPKDYEYFTSGSDSFWEILLVTQDGTEHKTTYVEYLEHTPYEEVMFPYLNQWSKAYRVLFPKVGVEDDFKLVLRSVVGKSELQW